MSTHTTQGLILIKPVKGLAILGEGELSIEWPDLTSSFETIATISGLPLPDPMPKLKNEVIVTLRASTGLHGETNMVLGLLTKIRRSRRIGYPDEVARDMLRRIFR